MVDIFKAHTISKSLLCIIFLMSFINSVVINDTIYVDETNNTLNYTEKKELGVNLNLNFTQGKEYLKIELISKKENIEYVLSYYEKDSTLKDRKQLSQSISGRAFIYLKKAQFNQTFYISVLSEDSSYDYQLIFSPKEKMELKVGEQYSYYVTEHNKAMEFFINETPEVQYVQNYLASSNYKLSFWARGSKNINATIKELNNQTNINQKKKDGFNAYLLQFENLINLSYTFTVEGNPGDLIKVGTFFFGKDNLCQTFIKDHKMEIFGFLKKDIMENVLFLTEINGLQLAFDSVDVYDYSLFQKSIFKKDNGEHNVYEFSLTNEKNEQFYLFQFSKKNEKLFKVYSPLILGGSYMLHLKKDEKVGLLPMLSENNNYLTYQITTDNCNHKSSLVNYTDYPLCKNAEKKETSLLQYYSSSFTYKNTEYNNKISPIDHNQKLLELTCQSNDCKIFVSIFTEKNNITIFPSMNYYRYIRKGSKDNFMIDLTPDINKVENNIKWFINIEVQNGNPSDIKTNLPEKDIIQKNNIILYEQNLTKLRDIPLTIEAKEKNVVYSIMIKKLNFEFNSQINYLVKYDNNIGDKPITFNIDKNHLLYFVGFYLFSDDEFKVENQQNSILKGNAFYQDIKENKNNEPEDISAYNITKNNSKESSLFELSLFKFNNGNLDDSIILSNNIVHPFMFTEKYSQFKFMYLNADNKNNVKINVNLLNKTKKYKMDLYINNNKKKSYNFNQTQDISVNSNNFTKVEYQLNKIEFVITSEEKSVSTIEIKIEEKKAEENTGGNKNDKGNNNNLFIIISCSIIGVIVILIIVVIIILCKSKKSYDDLREKVNSVSFKADKNDEEEDLLD